MALYRGDGLGGSAGTFSQLKFRTTPTLTGGGGAAGTTTMSILAHAVGDASAAGEGTGLVTYDAAVGVRLLAPGEYASTISPGSSTNNVSVSSAVAAINSATSIKLAGDGRRQRFGHRPTDRDQRRHPLHRRRQPQHGDAGRDRGGRRRPVHHHRRRPRGLQQHLGHRQPAQQGRPRQAHPHRFQQLHRADLGLRRNPVVGIRRRAAGLPDPLRGFRRDRPTGRFQPLRRRVDRRRQRRVRRHRSPVLRAAGSFNGVISGDGSFFKGPSGFLSLGGVNTYTGPTTADGGTLELLVNQATPPLTLGGSSNTILQLRAPASPRSRRTSTSAPATTPSSALVGDYWANPGVLFSGNVSIAGLTVQSDVGYDQVQFAGNLSGTGPLTLYGGRIILQGNNSGYSGAVTIGNYNSGTVVLGSNTALGTGAVTISGAGGGKLEAIGGPRTLANPFTLQGTLAVAGSQNLTLAGTVDLGNTTRTFDISNTALTTVSGVIAQTGGTAGLIKQGFGTLVLSNANTYAGPTTVASGTRLSNTTGLATGTGTVTVGACGVLSGSGTFGRRGHRRQGWNGRSGQLSRRDDRGRRPNTSVRRDPQWDLAALSTINPGTDSDRIVVTAGNLSVSPTAVLELSFLNGTDPTANVFWAAGHTWADIIDLAGAASNTGGTGTLSIDNSAWSALEASSPSPTAQAAWT